MPKRSLFRAALFAALLTCTPARGDQPPGQAPALDPALSTHDNLARLQGTKAIVEVVLASGKSYRGRVANVGAAAVLLADLQGREFFDALIRLDDVVALELRTRGTP